MHWKEGLLVYGAIWVTRVTNSLCQCVMQRIKKKKKKIHREQGFRQPSQNKPNIPNIKTLKGVGDLQDVAATSLDQKIIGRVTISKFCIEFTLTSSGISYCFTHICSKCMNVL